MPIRPCSIGAATAAALALTFCAAGIAPGHAQEAAAALTPLQTPGLRLARDPALLPRTGRRTSPDPYMALIRASQQAIGLTSPEQQKQAIPGIDTSLQSGMARTRAWPALGTGSIRDPGSGCDLARLPRHRPGQACHAGKECAAHGRSRRGAGQRAAARCDEPAASSGIGRTDAGNAGQRRRRLSLTRDRLVLRARQRPASGAAREASALLCSFASPIRDLPAGAALQRYLSGHARRADAAARMTRLSAWGPPRRFRTHSRSRIHRHSGWRADR